MIIAGDVGGTKVRLALFEKQRDPIYQEKYRSRDFSDFSSLLKQFMDSCPKQNIQKACFGVAGSVLEGRCQTTNLPWVIDARVLSEQMDIPNVWLINDLEANAWGLQVLEEKELFVLNQGIEKKGNAALIAAGTGLGEAGIYWNGHRYLPFACEGGHADFAGTNEEEIELWKYLKKMFTHVSYERVLSGAGIFRIYRFLVDTGREQKNVALEGKEERDEPQKIIMEQALKFKCPACLHTLNVFASIYGTEAGNLALKMLAIHSLYIGGGIAPLMIDILSNGQLMKAFVAKGRFQSLMSEIPVKVILNDQTALLGAAEYARQYH